MLEKPDIPVTKIAACLQAAYGVTAVYRIETANETTGETACFLKLRSGVFDKTAVSLPQFLHDQGIRQIITPLTTKTGQLWTRLDEFTVILYPFVDGRNGRERKLSAAQWAAFGGALKKLHTLAVPPAIKAHFRQEDYSPRWREMVKMFLERVESDVYDDPVALELAAFLHSRRAEILDIVDWDDPLLAPKERDLMFIGGTQGFVGYNAQEEKALFYHGYGHGYGRAAINPRALAYYRYERIIEDIALFCEQLLLSNAGGQDRAQSLHYLVSNFLPDGTIEAARRADREAMSLKDFGIKNG
jgi:spectinomycin phosphotransferase